MTTKMARTMSYRWQLWRFIRERIFKVQEGNQLPLVAFIIGLFLFPSRGLTLLGDKLSPVKYNLRTDTITIYGMRYSGSLFWAYSERGYPNGSIVQIAKRDNCVLVLTLIKSGEGNQTIKEEVLKGLGHGTHVP